MVLDDFVDDFVDDFLDVSSKHGSGLVGLFGAAKRALVGSSHDKEIHRKEAGEWKEVRKTLKAAGDDPSIVYRRRPVSMNLCEVCLHFDPYAEVNAIRPPVQLFKFVKCDVCRFFAKYISHECDEDVLRTLETSHNPMRFKRNKVNLYGRDDINLGSSKWKITTGVKEFEDEAFLRILPVSEASSGVLEIDLIKSWLYDCEFSHECTRDCGARSDLVLIDVFARRIVPAPRNARYCILSYVWGDVKRDSVGGLRGDMLPARAHQTIEDAMSLTALLDEKYLWVDIYCVDQSNATRKQEQIQHMDTIFEGAFLTIVAIGSATSISGISGISRLTPERQYFASLSRVGLSATRTSEHHKILAESRWNGRGWTLQEELLSRRLLFLADEQYWLQCRDTRHSSLYSDASPSSYQTYESTERAQWPLRLSGTGPLKRRDGNNSARRQASIPTSYSDDPKDMERQAFDLRDYLSITELYSTRALSVQSDILNAFAGIQTRAKSQLGFELYSSLPSNNLVAALCWTSRADERREGWPSWSWTGWRGEVGWHEITQHCSSSDMFGAYLKPPQLRVRLLKNTRDSVLDFQRGCIKAKLKVISVNEKCLQVSSTVAALNFRLGRTGANCWLCFNDGRMFSYDTFESKYHRSLHGTGMFSGGGVHQRLCRKRYDTKELLPGHFQLCSADATLYDPEKVNKAEFVMLLSVRDIVVTFEESNTLGGKFTKGEGQHEFAMVWALMIIREEGNVARRAALVRLPTELWKEARPRDEQLLLV